MTALKSIENEYRMLKLIHSRNTEQTLLRGIQTEPKELIEIAQENGEITFLAIVNEFYNRRLSLYLEKSNEVKEALAKDILLALINFNKTTIIHGDIKKTNFLINKKMEILQLILLIWEVQLM